MGLMMLSDGMVHFLKIEKNFKQIYQNYLVALSCIYMHNNSSNFKIDHEEADIYVLYDSHLMKIATFMKKEISSRGQ